jgi:hypothetical protein
MASNITHLPHIQQVTAGRELYDPMHQSIFEVSFELPDAIAQKFASDVEILTEQVTAVSGLDALQKTVQAGQQKFLGVDVSFLNPVLDNTRAEFTITLNLNLRNAKDAYVLKVFKAWGKLGYDLSDGTRTLMKDYVANNLTINEANRDGTIWRSFIFHKVMLTNMEGLNELSYENNDARQITVSFVSDYWDEDLG